MTSIVTGILRKRVIQSLNCWDCWESDQPIITLLRNDQYNDWINNITWKMSNHNNWFSKKMSYWDYSFSQFLRFQ